MTPESKQIVEIVDRFPHFTRERFLNSVKSLAEIYRLTVLETPLQRVRAEESPVNGPPADNVLLFVRRSG